MTDHPRSRPVRWGRLFVILFVVLLGLAFMLHWSWSIGARKRLDKQVAAYRAKGEPIEPQDFVVSGVLDADNAALDLRAAAAAIDRKGKPWATFDGLQADPALPLRPDELSLLRELITTNPAVLPKVASATTKPAVDWQIVFTTPTIMTLLPDLTPQRELARFLRADAHVAHADGDHGRAVGRVEEILFIGRAVGRQPLLVPNLVSIGINALASDLAMELAPDLRIANDQPGAATPQQVRALIARLLDERDLIEAQRNGLLGERMAQLDAARSFNTAMLAAAAAPGGAPAKGNPFVEAILKPTTLQDGVLMMRHTTAVMEAAGSSASFPEFKRTAPPFPQEVKEDRYMHVLASVFMPSLERAVEVHYRIRVERRMAAVALAVRLYAAEHDGRLPESLDQLVPDYLPAVPRDTMAPTTRPLGYVTAGDSPLIYSVGENGTDEGGSTQVAKPRARPDPPTRWEMLDAVTHLNRQPRPEPEVMEELSMEELPEPATAPAQ